MRESKLKVLSRRRCLQPPRPGCIDSVSCLDAMSHKVMNSNARATKQPCNACYTGSGGKYAESSITPILT